MMDMNKQQGHCSRHQDRWPHMLRKQDPCMGQQQGSHYYYQWCNLHYSHRHRHYCHHRTVLCLLGYYPHSGTHILCLISTSHYCCISHIYLWYQGMIYSLCRCRALRHMHQQLYLLYSQGRSCCRWEQSHCIASNLLLHCGNHCMYYRLGMCLLCRLCMQ